MNSSSVMLGYVLVEPGRAELVEVPIPEPKAGEVLVKTTVASICATDLKIVDGRFPVQPGLVLGHEFVGVVSAVGAGVQNLSEGQRVMSHTDTPCGQCQECLANWNGQGCSQGGSINAFHYGVFRDGAHAEYVCVPYANANVEPIPDNVTDVQAVMLCDVITTGFAAVESAQVRFGDVVVIFGQGPVGAASTIASRLSGAALVIVVDEFADRLELAKTLGADHAILANSDDIIEEIRTLTNGYMADVAIEAVGLTKTFGMALRATRPAGTLSTVGNFGMQGELQLPLDMGAFMGGVGNKKIFSTTSPGGRDRARRLLSMVSHGKFDPSIFVRHHFPLSDIPNAYELFRSKADNVFKIAITP